MSIKNLFRPIGDLRILAKEIGPDIDESILEVVVEGYKLLFDERIVKKDWSEDKITLELFMRIQTVWKRTNLTAAPVHQ